MVVLNLADFNPIELPDIIGRKNLADAFDLGRCCAYLSWWQKAFILSGVIRCNRETDKSSTTNDPQKLAESANQDVSDHEFVLFGVPLGIETNSSLDLVKHEESVKVQFEKLYYPLAAKIIEKDDLREGLASGLLSELSGQHSEDLVEGFSKNFNRNPESLVDGPLTSTVWLGARLEKFELESDTLNSVLLGSHFDTLIRSYEPLIKLDDPVNPVNPVNLPPFTSQSWEIVFGRHSQIELEETDIVVSEEWVHYRDRLLRQIHVSQDIISDLRFDSTGAELVRELYAAHIKTLNNLEEEKIRQSLKPGYLDLIVDSGRREIRREKDEYPQPVELQNAQGLWNIFVAIYEQRETPITGKGLKEKLGIAPEDDVTSQIDNLRNRLINLGITVSRQKYMITEE
jgi:hypothetical protein